MKTKMLSNSALTPTNSAEQGHGFTQEDLAKAAFPGSSDCSRKRNAVFDIEAKFDKNLNLPTSVKTTVSNDVHLSDAARFFSIKIPFRLLVIHNVQENDWKVPDKLYEFFMTPELITIMMGDISLSDIDGFSTYLKHLPFDHLDKSSKTLARAEASKYKKKLPTSPYATLNPKVGSTGAAKKRQSRLQASTSIDQLIALMEIGGGVCIIHEPEYLVQGEKKIVYNGVTFTTPIYSKRRNDDKNAIKKTRSVLHKGKNRQTSVREDQTDYEGA